MSVQKKYGLISVCVTSAMMAALLGSPRTVAQLATDESVEKPDTRFAALKESLSGVAMVGNYTVSGEKPSELKAERYELESVQHLGDDRWLITARIHYGEHDVTLPLPLPIRWAGDTPVISLDNMMIPGLGTFTARVMIYADHYAGFWSGGDHGGHLFGVIVRDSEKGSQNESTAD